MRRVGLVACVGDRRSVRSVLVGKTRERDLLEDRRRWENTIKMDLQEIGWRGLGWLDLAQRRDVWRVIVNAVLKLRVPKMRGSYFLDEELLASREALCCTEFRELVSIHHV